MKCYIKNTAVQDKFIDNEIKMYNLSKKKAKQNCVLGLLVKGNCIMDRNKTNQDFESKCK